MITHGRPIVVGIDGGPSDYDQALGYAAEAARRWRAGLRVVHGCEPHSFFPRMDEPAATERLLRHGRQQARIAARRLRDLVPAGREISVSISPDTGPEALIAESRQASLVVLQRRGVAGLKRIATGSTSTSVAAEAASPVVVVRAAASGGDGDVIVGVDAAGHAQAALAAAFAEAESWGCGLTAVHAWQWQDPTLELGYVAADPDDVFGAEESRRARLAQAVADPASAYPGVAVRQVVAVGPVRDVLAQASVGARLLVVSRHKPSPTPRALGSIARHCIAEAHCPVMVVRGSRPPRSPIDDPVPPSSDRSPASLPAGRGPDMDTETQPVAELSLAECRQRLRAAGTGRVAWTAPDGPHLLPVSCLYRSGNIVFRTSPTGVLAALRERVPVAFEIDQIAGDEAWSVVVRGFAQEIHQSYDLIELWEDEGLIPWAIGKRPVFIEIEPRTISGRRYRAPLT